MCGRYILESERPVHITLKEKDFLPETFQGDLFNSYNIAPTQTVPVMRELKNLEFMHWWLIPGYEKEFKAGKFTLFNKKSEELEKPYWKKLVASQRVVIPMGGFYEWKKLTPKDKTPYLIKPSEDGMFWVAGLYDNWVNRETGEVKRSFTMLTMAPNEFMAEVHNRMPVFLDPQAEDVAAWLAGAPPEEILKPFPSDRMTKYEVGPAVGNSRNNYKELTNPV
ncbi:SOS response-associated peptidase [Chitinophaga lutea]|nr:SOS response-associated peptidase [Chitinophaga lutea]